MDFLVVSISHFLESIFEMRNIHTIHTNHISKFFVTLLFLELQKIKKNKRGQKGSLYKVFLSLLHCFDEQY